MRLTSAPKISFGEDKRMTLVLNDATYHYGYDKEVKVLGVQHALGKRGAGRELVAEIRTNLPSS